MNPDEQALADRVYAAIQSTSNYSERSQQSTDFRIGVSDLGWCSERVRRMLAGIGEPVTDKLAAFIGTAIGDHVEAAALLVWPEAIRKAEVTLTLTGEGGRTYRLSGHPDLLVPEEGLVIDFKTTRGLSIVRRKGPDDQQQFQRHGYAKGAWESGLFGDLPLEEVRVANVWLDRAADEHELHVQMEPYDPGWIEQAGMWVDEVVYAYLHQQPARKEPPREMCAKVCGHFADCRALDTDTEGLLTAENVLTAVEVYREGVALESRGRKMKDEARAELRDIQGTTGKFSVRWVQMNGGRVEYDRAPYSKLDVKPM